MVIPYVRTAPTAASLVPGASVNISECLQMVVYDGDAFDELQDALLVQSAQGLRTKAINKHQRVALAREKQRRQARELADVGITTTAPPPRLAGSVGADVPRRAAVPSHQWSATLSRYARADAAGECARNV